MNRYFVRCNGCLEVSSVEADSLPYGLKCGICGSSVANMGRVQRGNEGSRLVKDHVRCACDERCTSARGPLCSCSCGGKNHGAGMAAVIRYTTDAGSVPTVQARTPELEAAALARFAEYREVRDQVKAEEEAIYARRRAGEFLPRPVFDRMLAIQRSLIDAGKAKMHTTRMKKLRALLAAGTVATVATVSVPAAPVATPAVRPATPAQIGYIESLAKKAAKNGAAVPAFSLDGLTLPAASALINTLKAVAA